MNGLQRFFGHLHTVNKHRRTVRKLCFKCGLYWQGITHDLSKYSPTEFWNGVKFYTGTASPHIGERKAYGYSKAWLNHKGHNKHHAECGITDEDNFGFTYAVLNKYIRTGICDDEETKDKIDAMHERNLFKLMPIPTFKYSPEVQAV